MGQGEDLSDSHRQEGDGTGLGGHAVVKGFLEKMAIPKVDTKYFPFKAVRYVSDLPKPRSKRYMIYIVLESVDIDNRAGFWYSNGTSWNRLGMVLSLGDLSNPPKGKCKVTNLFVDPETGRLEVEWNDIPEE